MSERERVAAALAAIEEWIGPQGPPGVGAVVWRRGDIIGERYAGEARPGVAVGPETIFPLASVTKPVAAATILTLVEAGIFGLDETAGRYVPDFRTGPPRDAPGADPALEQLRATITIRQLLCHVSGLPEDVAGRLGRFTTPATLDQIVDVMCRLPLESAPGAELRYSNAGYGVLGRVVERATDRPLWGAARENVFAPLGLRNVFPGPPADALPRVAHLADATHAGTALETYNSPYWRGLQAPWAGLYGTPRDLARFAGAFLPGGDRIMSAAGIRAMTADQTDGAPGGVESARVVWPVGRWGLGWEVKGDKRRHWTGELTSAATFCHFGHAGTLLWADPATGTALAVFANRAVSHMWTFILDRWARLSNAVSAAVS
ncbi:MAG: beta-lactamase family protein [Thermomicrobiales bacterium]|nr:beta-lactamase family protein [Thermomicrobiales bacterium]